MPSFPTPAVHPDPLAAFAPRGAASAAGAGAHHAGKGPLDGPLRKLGNAKLAAQRTLANVVNFDHVGRSIKKNVGYVVPGVALTAASGLAFGMTVAPACLRVGGDVSELAGTLRALPVVGPLMARMLGSAGPFGLWASSFCLLSASMALLTGEGPRDQRLKWAVAHVCQGFALAPFWRLAVAGALPGMLPGFALAAACAVGTSLLLADTLRGERPTWGTGLLLTTLTTAGAPLGAQLALGVGLSTAMATAGIALAVGALAGTFLVWRTHFAALEDDSTAELRRHLKPISPTCWLNLPGNEAKATVFVNNQHLREALQSIKVNLDKGGVARNERLLLSGPPGTGKSQTVMAIARELGCDLFGPNANIFIDSDTPATKITGIIEQARLEAKRQNKPVVLCFDESEKLFPDRAKLAEDEQGTIKGTAAHIMTTTFNAQFEGINEGANDNVIVIMCTNHPEKLDAAAKSRFSGSRWVTLDVPDEAITRDIVRATWGLLRKDHLGLGKFKDYAPSQADLDAMTAACRGADAEAAGGALVGRDIHQAIKKAYESLNGAPAAELAALSQADFERRLQARFLEEVAELRRQARVRAAQAPAQTARGAA